MEWRTTTYTYGDYNVTGFHSASYTLNFNHSLMQVYWYVVFIGAIKQTNITECKTMHAERYSCHIPLPAEHWWYDTIFTQHSHQMHFTFPMKWKISKHSYNNFLPIIIFCSEVRRTCNKHIHRPMFFSPLECNVLDWSSVLTHKLVNLYLTQMYRHQYYCIWQYITE